MLYIEEQTGRDNHMDVYIQPILTAALVFVVLTFLLFVPWCIYTFRKYGFLSISKSIIMFSFIFYFFAALFLVLLPLPETTNYCAQIKPNTVFYNLRPFQFVIDILYKSGISLTSPGTWVYTFKQPSFYQAFFNFLLLMPLGVYLRYFFGSRRYWKRAFFIGLGMTLFYEITQVTGIYGIYDCPYRIFDVDDLLLNSTGALIGFFIAPVVLALLPSHKEVVEHANEVKKRDKVGPLMKLFAVLLDVAIINWSWDILVMLTNESGMTFEMMYKTIMYFVMFAIIPIATNGATVTMLILRFRMVPEASTNFVTATLRRFTALYVTYFVFEVARIVNSFQLNMESDYYVFSVFAGVGTWAIAMLTLLVLIIHGIIVLLSRGKRRFYFDEVAKLVSTRKEK